MRQNNACGNLVTFIHNWQVLGGLFSAHVVVGRRWMNQRGRWMRHVRWHWYQIVIFLKSITKRLIEWYVRVEEWWRFKYMKGISWNRRWQTMNGKIMQMSWWWWVSSVLFALVAVWLLVDTAGWWSIVTDICCRCWRWARGWSHCLFVDRDGMTRDEISISK